MKKIIALLAVVMMFGSVAFASEKALLNKDVTVVGLKPEGQKLAERLLSDPPQVSGLKKIPLAKTEDNVQWYAGFQNQGPLVNYVLFGGEQIPFEELPFYLVYGLVWDESENNSFPLFLAWPSLYYSEEVFKEEPQWVTQIAPLSSLAGPGMYNNTFAATNSIFAGYTEEGWQYFPLLTIFQNFEIDSVIRDDVPYVYYYDSSLDYKSNPHVVLNSFEKNYGTNTLDADFYLPLINADDKIDLFELQYTGEGIGDMCPVGMLPETAGNYYISSYSINGEYNPGPSEETKFNKIDDYTYEWTGESLSTGIFITNEEIESIIGGVWGQTLYLGEPYSLNSGFNTIPTPIIIDNKACLHNVRVVLDTQSATLTVYAESYDPYTFRLYGSFNDFGETMTEEDIFAPDWDYVQTVSRYITGNGALYIGARYDNHDFFYLGGNVDNPFTVTEQRNYVFSMLQNPVEVEYSLTDQYSITMNTWSRIVFFQKENDAATPMYIIGDNVNGLTWTLGQEDARMTYIGDGIYEWNGQYLGTGFKFNSGTWDGEYNIGTGENSFKGVEVNGEAYSIVNSGNSGNIGLENCKGVSYPYVRLDVNNMTVTVTGYPVGETESWYFVIEGEEGELTFSHPLKADDYEGYSCYSMPAMDFDGVTGFKISNYGFVRSFSSYDSKVTEDYTTIFMDMLGSNLPFTPVDLTGRYSVYVFYLDEINGYPYVVFVKDGGDDPQEPSLTLQTNGGLSMTMPVPSPVSLPISFDLDPYWSVTAAVWKSGAYQYYLDVVDNSFETPVVTAPSTVKVSIDYTGELIIADDTTGVVDIEGDRLSIEIRNGEAVINGTREGDTIVIYNLNGQIIDTFYPKTLTTVIKLERGQYVIRVNDKAVKAIL